MARGKQKYRNRQIWNLHFPGFMCVMHLQNISWSSDVQTCMTFTLGTSHTPNTMSKSKSTLPAVRAVTGISKSFMPPDFVLALVEVARLICGSVKRNTNNFSTAKALSQITSFKMTGLKLCIIYYVCRFSLTVPFYWNNIGFLSRLICNLFLWRKAEFLESLLQSSVLRDPSEIILTCLFTSQKTFRISINLEKGCAASYFSENHDNYSKFKRTAFIWNVYFVTILTSLLILLINLMNLCWIKAFISFKYTYIQINPNEW